MKHYQFIIASIVSLCAANLQAADYFQPFFLDNPELVDFQYLPQEQQSFIQYYLDAQTKISEGADASDFFTITHAPNTDEQEPLLGDIRFGQDEPFNNLCPHINGKRAVTGCVATAMASVMTYYQYPNCGTGTVTYSGGANGAKTINLEDYPFDWNNILHQYTRGSYNEQQADAVATLMLACGAALNMQYSADGSGIFTEKVPGVMKNNFHFDPSIAFYSSKNYPNPEELFEYDWGPTIREQTKGGKPVIFAGHPAQGQSGHCFVIDGYKTIDGIYYYHVDWGWTGYLNGYFLLTNLNPDGTSYSGYACTMVIDIFPLNWTSIGNINADNQSNQTIYNILGQPVTPEARIKGNIYIQNGQKYLYQ